MKKSFVVALICLAGSTSSGFARTPGEVSTAQAAADSKKAAPDVGAVPSSKELEGELQRLPWKQFRAVVEAVPKLKADVEAYGEFGWKFVRTNYSTYGWKKNIDKLDDTQKKQLAELIQNAKGIK